VLTDLVEATAIDRTVENATEVLGLAARKAVDSAIARMILFRRTSLSSTLGIGAGAGHDLSGVVNKLSAAQFQIPLMRPTGGACTALDISGIAQSATLTVTFLRAARKYLEGKDAPTFPDGTYHAVTHPDALNELTGTSGWIAMNQYTNLKPLTGEVGTCQNIRCKTSTNMPVITASTWIKASAHGGGTIHLTYVYGPWAYGVTEINSLRGGQSGAELIIKKSDKATLSDPLNQTPHTIGYKVTHAVKVLNNSCIVGLLTGKGTATAIPV